MDSEIVQDLANTTVHNIPEESSSEHIVGEIIISLTCLISLCADSIIIYTIFKFKNMCTVSNVLLGNWIIANACLMVLSFSHFRIISVIGNFDLPMNFICGLFEILVSIRNNQIVFAVIVNLDWLSGIYFPRLSEKIKSYYKFIIATFWIIGMLYSTILVGLCINHLFYFSSELVVVFVYCILLLVVVISLSTIGIHKCTGRLLNYATHVVMLSSVLIIMCFTEILSMLIWFRFSLEIFFECLVSAEAVLNFIILYCFNKDFKVYFLKVIRRYRSEHSNALSNANANSTNNANSDRPVQIAFHGPTEELITNAY